MLKKKCLVPNNVGNCKTVNMCCNFCDKEMCLYRCKLSHTSCKYAEDEVYYTETKKGQMSLL